MGTASTPSTPEQTPGPALSLLFPSSRPPSSGAGTRRSCPAPWASERRHGAACGGSNVMAGGRRGLSPGLSHVVLDCGGGAGHVGEEEPLPLDDRAAPVRARPARPGCLAPAGDTLPRRALTNVAPPRDRTAHAATSGPFPASMTTARSSLNGNLGRGSLNEATRFRRSRTSGSASQPQLAATAKTGIALLPVRCRVEGDFIGYCGLTRWPRPSTSPRSHTSCSGERTDTAMRPRRPAQCLTPRPRPDGRGSGQRCEFGTWHRSGCWRSSGSGATTSRWTSGASLCG